jgi:hypothetical protein
MSKIASVEYFQSRKYPCDIPCDEAKKEVIGDVYAIGGGADWETVTTYDPEGNADDYYVHFVEHEEGYFVDVRCSGCGSEYATPYPD